MLRRYRFYATLLDAFQRYLDTSPETFLYQCADGSWHRNYNENTGEFTLEPVQVEALSKQRLLDIINRVSQLPSEAATKGTMFNEIVDCIIHKRKPSKGIVATINQIDTLVGLRGDEQKDSSVNLCNAVGKPFIYAALDGFEFCFDIDLCKSAAECFVGAVSQCYTNATITTDNWEVELYGYIDELVENKVIDIKTTKRYEFGQYEKYWQRYVYPYCLIESGLMKDVSEFVFSCWVLSGGTSRTPLITGKKYDETYTYSHEKSKEAITQICDAFTYFLECNKELITDKKILGL